MHEKLVNNIRAAIAKKGMLLQDVSREVFGENAPKTLSSKLNKTRKGQNGSLTWVNIIQIADACEVDMCELYDGVTITQ